MFYTLEYISTQVLISDLLGIYLAVEGLGDCEELPDFSSVLLFYIPVSCV